MRPLCSGLHATLLAGFLLSQTCGEENGLRTEQTEKAPSALAAFPIAELRQAIFVPVHALGRHLGDELKGMPRDRDICSGRQFAQCCFQTPFADVAPRTDEVRNHFERIHIPGLSP